MAKHKRTVKTPGGTEQVITSGTTGTGVGTNISTVDSQFFANAPDFGGKFGFLSAATKQAAQSEFTSATPTGNNFRQLLNTGTRRLNEAGLDSSGLSDAEKVQFGIAVSNVRGGMDEFKRFRAGRDTLANPAAEFQLPGIERGQPKKQLKLAGARGSGGPLQGPSRMTTTQFARSFREANGRAPTNDELIAFTQQRSQGTALPDIVKNLDPKITPDSLKSKSKLNLKPLGDGDGSSADRAAASAAAVSQGFEDDELAPKEQQKQNILDELTGIAEGRKDLVTERERLLEEENVAEKKAARDKSRRDIEAKISEFEQYKLAQEGKAITMSSITGNIAQKRNLLASEILVLQGQAQLLQDDYDSALESVNSAIDLENEVLDREADIYQSQLDAIAPSLDREDRERLAVQQARLDKENDERDAATAEKKEVAKFVLDLAKKYPDAKIKLTDTPEEAQAKVPSSKVFQQATRLANGPSGPSGPSSLGLTASKLQTARSNYLIANPDNGVEDFDVLSDGDKLRWAGGGPEPEPTIVEAAVDFHDDIVDMRDAGFSAKETIETIRNEGGGALDTREIDVLKNVFADQLKDEVKDTEFAGIFKSRATEINEYLDSLNL